MYTNEELAKAKLLEEDFLWIVERFPERAPEEAWEHARLVKEFKEATGITEPPEPENYNRPTGFLLERIVEMMRQRNTQTT